MIRNKILEGDCIDQLKTIPSEYVDLIVTSPPYWGLRDYGVEGQIGLEPTLDEYHKRLLQVTAECKRVLKKTGTMFWVHGDSYDNKTLTMQNYRLTMRMVDEQGWILRNTLIWHKRNRMPSSVRDRFTNAYEPVFFFSKSKKYWFDLDAIRVPQKEVSKKHYETAKTQKEDNDYKKKHLQVFDRTYRTSRDISRGINPNIGKNPGDVFSLTIQPFTGAHFAVFPEKLIEPFIKAGCPITGIVLDPFMGAGTTAVEAKKLGRDYLGIEINPEYIEITCKRVAAIPTNLNKYLKDT